MACHVSSQDVGGCLSCPSERERGRIQRVEWWPVGGGLISRPLPFWMLVVRVATVPLDGRGEVAPRGGVGGEDAPVGKGPRRTRPHLGARTKYIAPKKIPKSRR